MPKNNTSATIPHDIPRLLRMIGLSYRIIAKKLKPTKTPTTVSAYFNNRPFCGPATGKQIQEIVNEHKATAVKRLEALDR